MKVLFQILFFLGLCLVSESIHYSFCHLLDQSSLDSVIGGRQVFPQNQISEAYSLDPSAVKMTIDGANVQAFGIKATDNNGVEGPLKGWIHIVVDFSRSGTTVAGLLIQAEQYENPQISGIGQFVHNFPWEACSDVTADSNSGLFSPPLHYQFVPCAGSSLYEPLPSNTFIYNRVALRTAVPQNQKSSPIVHLFWRFSNYYCNQVKNIRFRVNVVQSYPGDGGGRFGKPLIVRLSNNLFDSAADPMPSKDQVKSCRENLRLGSEFPWITGFEERDEEIFSPSSCNNLNEVRSSFRCGSASQGCQSGTVGGTTVEYSEYVDPKLKSIGDTFKCPLVPQKYIEPRMQGRKPVPRSTTTTTEHPITLGYDPEQIQEMEDKDRVHGVFADRFPGSMVWKYRVWHGIVELVGAMFVTPVSYFVTRYYKESFMELDILGNRVWYIVHLISILVNICIHFCGGFAISMTKPIVGHSKDGVAMVHRYLGWSAAVLLMLMTLLGGFRPFPSTPRKVFITLHWLLGWGFQGICFAAVGNSVYIYGSPFANGDMSDLAHKSDKQTLFIVFIVWVAFYVGCHLVMTMDRWQQINTCLRSMSFLQSFIPLIDATGPLSLNHTIAIIFVEYVYTILEPNFTIPNYNFLSISAFLNQAAFGIKHVFLPVLIPLTEEDDETDSPGSEFRNYMLILVVGVSFIVTLGLCLSMLNIDPLNRGFGYCTCTHNESDHLVLIKENCRLE